MSHDNESISALILPSFMDLLNGNGVKKVLFYLEETPLPVPGWPSHTRGTAHGLLFENSLSDEGKVQCPEGQPCPTLEDLSGYCSKDHDDVTKVLALERLKMSLI
jgi:hypothetical protein